MRIVALLATYNERRFIGPCLEHLRGHGIDVYLIDNESTDGTVELAERHGGRSLLGIETLPREGDVFSLRAQLRRKEQVAREFEADWFIHLDADEMRLPPPGKSSLAEALRAVDRLGFSAVNFLELSFVPTREAPDHDRADFQRTLRTYYPLMPEFPHRLNAWKANPDVELGWKAGHRVRFAGLREYPRSFPMKHYLFLSVPHAVEKYVQRSFPPSEVEDGWHRWRERLTEDDIRLPAAGEVRTLQSDERLDPTDPSRYHYFDERWTSPLRGVASAAR
ncbi:MAG TPA: glycosyltransferase family 2 protein [Solirubrobacterales bacterium]|jgi:glycosyltransferase involved in cell wall biosynthesis|nr:glycosyltransferase family 2 protein [Solirubrobacterales bacterium]